MIVAEGNSWSFSTDDHEEGGVVSMILYIVRLSLVHTIDILYILDSASNYSAIQKLKP